MEDRRPFGYSLLVKQVSMISIVDDDESVRESLEGLLKSVGFRVKTFEGAEDFLDSEQLEQTQCLILDVTLGGMSGLELQRSLIARSYWVPIVFITAHGEEAVRAQALSDGAVDCLVKPFSEEALLAAVEKALTVTASNEEGSRNGEAQGKTEG